jgi:DUF1009 family protein
MRGSDSTALGLIAGRGRLPLDVARSARRSGRRVVAIAFHGQTDPQIDVDATQVTWLHLGEVGAAVEALRRGGVRQTVLAGKVPKSTLYGDPSALRLDARASDLIARLEDRRDDSLLASVASFLESEGFELLAQADLMPELVPGSGPLGRVEPSPAQRADVAFGWTVAKHLGALDIGQTVVVKDRAVLAVEAIEGTDAAIRRGGEICSGAVVVKVAKPRQDPRFDVPTIGLDTLDALVDARASVLIFEAKQTLVLEREALAEGADAHGIAVVGATADAVLQGDT